MIIFCEDYGHSLVPYIILYAKSLILYYIRYALYYTLCEKPILYKGLALGYI